MQERDEAGKSKNGFYRHKETGAVVELVNDPAFGSPLTNAFINAGYEYVGDIDPTTKALANEGNVQTGAPAPSGKPLAEYNVKELVEIAKTVGVEDAESFAKPGHKKADLIAAIEAAQEGNEE